MNRPAPALYSASDIYSLGLKKTHFHSLVSQGKFPQPAVRIGPRFTRWTAADVDAWFADPAGWMERAKTAEVEGANAAALIGEGAAR
jgi:predicted DNA-binding transcriptional regulator AlpA